MKVALQVAAGDDVTSVVPDIVRAEEHGFASVWSSGRYDALMQLLLAASKTSSIELGTGIITTWQRHPVALAQQALTLQSASGGRFTLGIGVGHRKVIEGQQGFEWRPVLHLREYLSVLAPLMSGETVTFAGTSYRLTEFRLGAAGLVPPAPVLVAALSPQMLRLAGRRADGTIIFLGGLRYVRDVAVPTIRAAAAGADRKRPRIIAGAPVLVSQRRAGDVRDEAAPKLANYDAAPAYRAILDLDGSARAVDVAVIGTESEVRARLGAYADAGVTDFLGSILAAHPDERERTYEVLAAVARGG